MSAKLILNKATNHNLSMMPMLTDEAQLSSGGRHPEIKEFNSSEGGERGNPAGENNEASGETSPTSLHSSPAEEDKLGLSFSDNGPSSIQGEGATSLFYEVGEWEKRGVTTPIH